MKKISIALVLLLVLSVLPAVFAQRGLGTPLGGVGGQRQLNRVGAEKGGYISEEIQQKYKPGLSGESSLKRKEYAKNDETLSKKVSPDNEIYKKRRARLEEFKKKLKACKAGELSKEECKGLGGELGKVKKKFEERKEELYLRKKEQYKERRARLEEFKKKLKACKAGELSKEECKGLGGELGKVKKKFEERKEELKEKLEVKQEAFVKRIPPEARERMKKAREEYLRKKEQYKERRARLEEFKKKLKACKAGELSKEECKGLGKLVINHGRDLLHSASDKITALLSQTEERIKNSNLPEERKKFLIEKLEARIKAVKKAKSEIKEGDVSEEDVKKSAKVLREAWVKSKRDIRLSAGRIAAIKIQKVIDKNQKVREKLKVMIEKLKNRGVNVEGLENALSNFEEKMEKAKEAHTEAKALFEAEEDDEAVKKAIDLIKKSNFELREAHKKLRNLLKELKQKSNKVVEK